ncbi:MAG: radical SAM protein [Candidatus Alcyoniella australis]|nr:radical SAM protein [Candidatus Alcyoniella australis]
MNGIIFVKPDQAFGIDVSPPLGVFYLAAVLREHGWDDIAVVDLRLKGQSEAALIQRVGREKPQFVGFSGLSYESEAIHRLAAAVKDGSPQTKVLIGGSYASILPQQALADERVDALVLGEGELVLPELLDRLRNDRPLDDLAGVAFRRDGEPQINPHGPFVEQLDELPYPAWDLARIPDYWQEKRQGFICKYPEYFVMFSSRGCPYRCIYCHNMFGKRFRARSAPNVLGEIERLITDHGVRELQFIDDIFNLDRERAAAIYQGIIDRGWKIAMNYSNGLRGDLLTPELIKLMARAGVYKVSVAIESGDAQMQRFIGKNLQLERARENVELLVRHGIMTHLFFMLGFPDETREQMQRTLDFARKSSAHSASFFIVHPFHGTRLAEILRERGRGELISLEASNYFDPKMADFQLSEVEPDELRGLVKGAFRSFYLNPARWWRIVRHIPRKRQLFFLGFLVLTRTFAQGLVRFERLLFHREGRSEA